MTATVTPVMVTTMHRGLTEFGYEVDRATVERSVYAMTHDCEPDNIIDLWIRGWLREAGIL